MRRRSRAIELNSGVLLCCFLLKFLGSGGTNSEQNAETLKHFAVWTFSFITSLLFSILGSASAKTPFTWDGVPEDLWPVFGTVNKQANVETHTNTHGKYR